jgi:SAM-dependent methyltransferase
MKYEQLSKSVGDYKHYDICRFCFSKNIIPVINLGYVPLAGGFLTSKEAFETEYFYPLEISFCKNCYLVQSSNVIDKDTIFKNYFYRSSAIKTLTEHFIKIADEIQPHIDKLIIEIGSNDGAFLKYVLEKKGKIVGVDPATNIVGPLIKDGLPIINDYFSEEIAKQIIKKYGKADIVFSSNTLAHIENMHDIFNGIKTLLKKDGMLIFEVHYLGNVLYEIQYDMIYHEHQYYYSLITLQKILKNYNLEIFDAKPIPIHAGSMRYYIKNNDSKKYILSSSVKKIIKLEKEQKLDKAETYLNFDKKIAKTKNDLLNLLKKLKKNGKTIVGYGASGRGTIIMNYCGLDKQYLDYIIDDAPAKQNAYTPGTHLKIVSSEILQTTKRPDYVLLFAWSFFEEIKKRNNKFVENGGKFIIPLPQVKIIE